MQTDWNKTDEEADGLFHRQMEEAKKASAADRDFFSAAQAARLSVTDDDLLPRRDQYGEPRYTAKQAMRAACHTREDVIALVRVEHAVLRRLDRIKALLWVAVGLLIYIAYKLT